MGAVTNHVGPLKEVRGKWKNVKIINNSYDILTTFHPAFLLRQPKQRKYVLKDLMQLKKNIK